MASSIVQLKRCVRFLALATGLMAGSVGEARAQAWFATECQRSFQNDWLPPTIAAWDICGGFNAELNDTDHQYYYYNLQGAQWRWHDAGDQIFMDDVDLLYAGTHGGQTQSGDSSVWGMWDHQQYAYSSSMRLGDEAWRLSVLATYACKTLKTSDGKHWTRMGPIFRGGLRYALGSHDQVAGGINTDEVGEDFADGLQKQKSFRYAWKEGNSDWWADQDLTAMTTGANATDCHNRRSGMKWQNFPYYAQLRDEQVGWVCWTKWDDI